MDTELSTKMKLIAELTDEKLLGTKGSARSKPGYKVRAVLQRADGLYAAIYEERTGLYSLPGGSIEDGEDILSALKREMLEETGCLCDDIAELGYVYENRGFCDLRQYSFFFSVKAGAAQRPQSFTREEIESGCKLIWCTLEELVSLIESGSPKTRQEVFLKERDTAAIGAFVSGAHSDLLHGGE